MPNNNPNLQRTAGFYHSLGKVQTESNNLVGNEKYKSAHNIKSSDVWTDEIQYSPNFSNASSLADDIIVTQLGTIADPMYLFPLTLSNYQTWFFDSGTPSVASDGFIPSENWNKNLISPSDVVDLNGEPSDGFKFRMFKNDGTPISYDNSFYDVDYYAGLIRFQESATPIDPLQSSGLGFVFNKSEFETTVDSAKLNYIKNQTTGGIRGLAFQYVGQTLDNLNSDNYIVSTTENKIYLTDNGLTYSELTYDSQNAYLGFSGTQSSNLDTTPNYFSLAFDDTGSLHSNINNSWVKYITEDDVVLIKENGGIKISDRDEVNYLPLGTQSIDLTINDGTIMSGASGNNAFAIGKSGIATGVEATSIMHGTASGYSSFVASSPNSDAKGNYNAIINSNYGTTGTTEHSLILSSYNVKSIGYGSVIISSFNATASNTYSNIQSSFDSINAGFNSTIICGYDNIIVDGSNSCFVAGRDIRVSGISSAAIGNNLTSNSNAEITVGANSLDIPRIGTGPNQDVRDIVFKIGSSGTRSAPRNQFYVFKNGLIKLTAINTDTAQVNPNIPDGIRGGFGLNSSDNTLRYHNGDSWKILQTTDGGIEPTTGTPPTSGTFSISLDNYLVTDYSGSVTNLTDLTAINHVLGGNARVKGKWGTKPIFTGGIEATNSDFKLGQVIYLYVENWADGVVYWYSEN